MKILYAIQGTGNGHISRAKDVIPILKQKGEVDILISGNQAEVKLPYKIDYKLHGMGFAFGKKGGIDWNKTFKDFNPLTLIKEIRKLPIKKYDIVINDFEPVSAWAAMYAKTPCVALSHQSAILAENSPKPKEENLIGKMVLKYYAPANEYYGFHFDKFNARISTPVIRKEIRESDATFNDYYTVYLPAYSHDYLAKKLSKIKDVKWHIFSKNIKSAYKQDNIHVQPVNSEGFIKSLTGCEGILCGAGFETPAESLFLEKKLMVVPMKKQYEQHCNAAALEQMGVPVLKSLKKKNLKKIENWIQNGKSPKVDYPDVTEEIVDNIFDKHLVGSI